MRLITILISMVLASCASYVNEIDKDEHTLSNKSGMMVMRTFGPKGGGNLLIRPVHLTLAEHTTSFITIKLHKSIDISEAGIHAMQVDSGYCYGIDGFESGGFFGKSFYDINPNAYATDKIQPNEIVYIGDLIFMYDNGYLKMSVKNEFSEVKRILEKEFENLLQKYPLRASILQPRSECK